MLQLCCINKHQLPTFVFHQLLNCAHMTKETIFGGQYSTQQYASWWDSPHTCVFYKDYLGTNIFTWYYTCIQHLSNFPRQIKLIKSYMTTLAKMLVPSIANINVEPIGCPHVRNHMEQKKTSSSTHVFGKMICGGALHLISPSPHSQRKWKGILHVT